MTSFALAGPMPTIRPLRPVSIKVSLKLAEGNGVPERPTRRFLFAQGLRIREALWQVFQDQPHTQRRDLPRKSSFRTSRLDLFHDFEDRL